MISQRVALIILLAFLIIFALAMALTYQNSRQAIDQAKTEIYLGD